MRRLTAASLLLLAVGCGAGARPAGDGPAPAPSATASAPTATPTSASPSASPAPSASPTRAPTPAPSATTVTPAADAMLREGSSGPSVLALQRRLVALHFWLGAPDGRFGPVTTQAVLALQKAAGISRDGVVGPQTRAALATGVRPPTRSGSGRWVEIDLTRQLLLLVADGRLQWVLNTSTGSGQTYWSRGYPEVAATPVGSFRVYRQVDGWDRSPLGELWRPKYFAGGVAVHGYASVPAYPASHGCVRVSIAAMNWLWGSGLLPVGARVLVHR